MARRGSRAYREPPGSLRREEGNIGGRRREGASPRDRQAPGAPPRQHCPGIPRRTVASQRSGGGASWLRASHASPAERSGLLLEGTRSISHRHPPLLQPLPEQPAVEEAIAAYDGAAGSWPVSNSLSGAAQW